MLDQFQERDLRRLRLLATRQARGLPPTTAVNLASIVEQASPTGDQQVAITWPRCSTTACAVATGPTWNRTRPPPTRWAATPTAEEVHAETPYSTYANPGLPPTPICSPGLESLTAVCEPTQTEDMFFYFYPDADGNMQAAFSKTYEEHQQAIADNSNAGGADGSGDAAAGEGAAA